MTSDKVWKTSSTLFHSIDKVEKRMLHAAVNAIRDEVDVLFIDHDDHDNCAMNTKRVKSTSQDTYKYPYGWGLD